MNKMRTIIEAGRVSPLTIRELWCYRELFWMLAWRNIIARYKQTFVGVAWALARPLTTMLAFSVIFGRVAKLSGLPGVPYPLLVFSGVLIWQFFAGMISGGCDALVGNRGLVVKVYFPRVIIPVSGVVVCMVDFLLASAVFLGLYLWFCRAVLSWRMLLAPLALVPLLTCALGIIFLLSALNVRYRDFRHIVPFLLQLGLFVSPVGYTGAAIPGNWRTAAWINPVYGVIGWVRWALFGAPLEYRAVIISLVEAVVFFCIGFAVFRHQEKDFSDFI